MTKTDGSNRDPGSYRFEETQPLVSMRATANAESDARVLLARLGVPDDLTTAVMAARHPGGEAELASIARMMVQLASEVCGNISWYEQAVPPLEDREKRQTLTLKIGASVGAVIIAASVWAPAWLALHHEGSQPIEFFNTGFWLASAGLALVISIGLGQVFVGSEDVRAQRDAFWKARAGLKEQLYTFEQTWRGRVGDREALLAGDFRTAMSEELGAARAIARTEREEFFLARSSPIKLLGSLETLLETALTRRDQAALHSQDAVAARATRRTARDDTITATRTLLVEERAKLASLEEGRRLALDRDRQAEFEVSILDSKVEVARLQALLSAQLKTARLIPV